MKNPRIIIVGGGFAGISCAQTIQKQIGKLGGEVILFNRENHMVFQPLLAEVVGASIDPDAICVPLRQLLPKVYCRTEEITSIDLAQKKVLFRGLNRGTESLSYDQLVLACGGDVNMGLVPGMNDHGYPLRNIGDALQLRAQVIQQLEKAEVCQDPEQRRFYLSFIIVGGGFSGAEVAGEINDLVRGSRRYYQKIDESDIRVTLVHSRDQILPEVSPKLREFAGKKMIQAGIHLQLNSRVALVTGEGVRLTDGTLLRGATVVCTVGNTTASLIEKMDAPKEKGWLITFPDLSLKDHPCVWAIGDCAKNLNAYDNSVCPTTGQFAVRHGIQAGKNLLRTLQNQPTQPFYFKPLGQLCAIGGRSAVAEIFGAKLSGFPAWWLWRTIYLIKLPSLARKAKVALDWTWELFFHRDLAHLQANPTQRIGHAYFHPGDYVFKQGDPATDFFLIEQGQAEVTRQDHPTDEEKVISILGPGDFFGEMALLNKGERTASVRARTPLEVVIIGSQIFSQISKSFKPLSELLANAMRRRHNIGKHLSDNHNNLIKSPLKQLIEPLPCSPLRADDPMDQAVQLFGQKHYDICLVVDGNNHTVGILTRTDLLTAIEAVNRSNAEQAKQLRIRDFMVKNPICLYSTDTSLVALTTMQDHGFSKLPVVKSQEEPVPLGYLRIETLMNILFPQVFEASNKTN